MGKWYCYTLREDVLIHALEDAAAGGDPVLIAMELAANAGITWDDGEKVVKDPHNGIIAITMTLPVGDASA